MYCRKPLAGFRKGKGNNPISFCKALSCGCGIGITAAQNRMRRSITKVKTNKNLKGKQCRHEKRTRKDKNLGFYHNGANWTFKNAHVLCITQTYYRHSTLRALEQYAIPLLEQNYHSRCQRCQEWLLALAWVCSLLSRN